MMRTSSTHEGTGRGGDGATGEIRLDPVGAAVEAMGATVDGESMTSGISSSGRSAAK